MCVLRKLYYVEKFILHSTDVTLKRTVSLTAEYTRHESGGGGYHLRGFILMKKAELCWIMDKYNISSFMFYFFILRLLFTFVNKKNKKMFHTGLSHGQTDAPVITDILFCTWCNPISCINVIPSYPLMKWVSVCGGCHDIWEKHRVVSTPSSLWVT